MLPYKLNSGAYCNMSVCLSVYLLCKVTANTRDFLIEVKVLAQGNSILTCELIFRVIPIFYSTNETHC